MKSDPTAITSIRLNLILLTVEILRLSLQREKAKVEQLLGIKVPGEWYDEQEFIRIRLEQITENPAYQLWGPRAISLREGRQMVGHIGFHTRPGAAYLQPYAPNGVEFGYTVFPSYRRQGYAREACQALMKWAHEQQRVSEFVVSIDPNNLASRRLAQGLGFARVGLHVDPQDGLEDIYRLEYRGTDPA